MPDTPPTAAGGHDPDAALLRAVAGMGPGWTVLRDCRFGEGEARARVRYALLHPDAGIALLDTTPGAAAPDAPGRLRRALDAAGFRVLFGDYPRIVHLRVPTREIHGLEAMLAERFGLLPPPALSGGDAWVVAAQGMLSTNPPLRWPWQGSHPGRQPQEQGAGIGFRPSPPAVPGPRGLAAFWGAVALVFGGGALLLQYLGPPQAPAAVSAHAGSGPAGASTLEASSAIASPDQARRPPSPGPVLAVWPAEPMPARLGAARAGFAVREGARTAGVAEAAADLESAPGGLDATGSDAEAANGGPGPTRADAGASSNGSVEAEAGAATGSTEAAETGTSAEADRAAASEAPPPTAPRFGAAEATPEREGNIPDRQSAQPADSAAPARAEVLPATSEPPAPAASAGGAAGDDRAGADAEAKPEAAVEMTAEPSADPNVAAPRTATPPNDPAASPAAAAESAPRGGGALDESPTAPLPQPAAPPAAAAAPPAPRAEPPAEARGATDAAVAPGVGAPPRPSTDEATPRPPAAPTPVARPVAAPSAPPQERAAEPAPPVAAAPPPRAVSPESGGGAPAPAQAAGPERRGPATPLPPALVEALIARGDAMMSRRDVSAARLLYERAAAAGEARAATALAKTYDPDFLAEIGAQGIRGDAAIAAAWYRRANSLGDTGALARAEALSGQERPAQGRP